jgi:acyl-CoA thioesterase-1
VVNGGNSGETSAGGLRRISWFMDDPVDIFVLELGANDGLRGVHVPQIRRNLQAIIDTVRSYNPQVEIVIAGMQIPPNMGQPYAQEFRALFPELARENDAVLIPFLLADVAGEESLNLYDRIHPNVAGHRIIAETVWTHLEPVLHELAGG